MKRWLSILFCILCSLSLLTACSSADTGSPTVSDNHSSSVSQTEREDSTSQAASQETSGASSSQDAKEESSSSSKQEASQQEDKASSQEEQKGQKAAGSSSKQSASSSKQETSRPQDSTSKAPETSSKPETPSKPSNTISVTISVDCSRAVAQGNQIAQAVSQNGMILGKTSLTLSKEASAYDALKETGLVINANKSAMGMYVISIQSLAEKMCGGESGWLFFVNGEYISSSCDKCILQDGDVLEWIYTCNNGEDI